MTDVAILDPQTTEGEDVATESYELMLTELADVLAASDERESALRWGALAPRLYARFEQRALSELREGR